MSNTPTGPEARPNAQGGGAMQREAAPSDFASTHPDYLPDEGSDWWPESADGHCSEHAALFAASQPAPLSVV